MATLTSALNTEFTPAVGPFNVQSTGGSATLQRKNSSGAAWADVGAIKGAARCDNEIAGAVYKFVSPALFAADVAVQADQ